MTDGQYQALTEAIGFLIKKLPPEKSDRAKAERSRILQNLLNARRASRSAQPEPSIPPSSAASPVGGIQSHDPSEPLTLRIDYVAPTSPVGSVDAGNVAGVPINQEYRDEAP